MQVSSTPTSTAFSLKEALHHFWEQRQAKEAAEAGSGESTETLAATADKVAAQACPSVSLQDAVKVEAEVAEPIVKIKCVKSEVADKAAHSPPRAPATPFGKRGFVTVSSSKENVNTIQRRGDVHTFTWQQKRKGPCVSSTGVFMEADALDSTTADGQSRSPSTRRQLKKSKKGRSTWDPNTVTQKIRLGMNSPRQIAASLPFTSLTAASAAGFSSKLRSQLKPEADRWDQRPEEAKRLGTLGLEPQARAMDLQQMQRHWREVYVGNLFLGHVDPDLLKKTFKKLFHHLPEFFEKYPRRPEPVICVTFPSAGGGAFAFVEFIDEVCAATASLMAGIEIAGRPAKVMRGRAYVPPPYQVVPLNVAPLCVLGLVPFPRKTQRVDVLCKDAATAECEVYFGNLDPEKVSEQVLFDFLMETCNGLPEYDVENGAPIKKMFMPLSRTHCVVEFRKPSMAPLSVSTFHGTELCGRKLVVQRPQSFSAGSVAEEVQGISL